jgi:hypothetical protein
VLLCLLIAGVHVGMVLARQLPIRAPYLRIRRSAGHFEHAVGILGFSHPAVSGCKSEAEMSEEELRRGGVSDALVRVSVEIEDCRDLLQDFRQALECDRALLPGSCGLVLRGAHVGRTCPI